MIKSAKYTSIKETSIIVTYDNGPDLNVPVAIGNRRYQEITDWISDDNTVGPFISTPEELEQQRLYVIERQRISAIEEGQKLSGIKGVTITQAHSWINKKLDSAANGAEYKEAVRVILHKIAIFIIK